MLHRLALSLHSFIVTTLIPTYLILNLSESKPIWCWTYLIPNPSDTEPISYQTGGLFGVDPSVLPSIPFNHVMTANPAQCTLWRNQWHKQVNFSPLPPSSRWPPTTNKQALRLNWRPKGPISPSRIWFIYVYIKSQKQFKLPKSIIATSLTHFNIYSI